MQPTDWEAPFVFSFKCVHYRVFEVHLLLLEFWTQYTILTLFILQNDIEWWQLGHTYCLYHSVFLHIPDKLCYLWHDVAPFGHTTQWLFVVGFLEQWDFTLGGAATVLGTIPQEIETKWLIKCIVACCRHNQLSMSHDPLEIIIVCWFGSIISRISAKLFM